MTEDSCGSCDIYEKIHMCCKEHPETKMSLPMILDGERFLVCTEFDQELLKCGSYGDRPDICRDFACNVCTYDLVDYFASRF
ncbi:hypothetical protein KY321_01890 [Candidatus Woesearchaeota archaeon]|nr:hypothetical protein [Candidatus Woesearchaeota archaeon]